MSRDAVISNIDALIRSHEQSAQAYKDLRRRVLVEYRCTPAMLDEATKVLQPAKAARIAARTDLNKLVYPSRGLPDEMIIETKTGRSWGACNYVAKRQAAIADAVVESARRQLVDYCKKDVTLTRNTLQQRAQEREFERRQAHYDDIKWPADGDPFDELSVQDPNARYVLMGGRFVRAIKNGGWRKRFDSTHIIFETTRKHGPQHVIRVEPRFTTTRDLVRIDGDFKQLTPRSWGFEAASWRCPSDAREANELD